MKNILLSTLEAMSKWAAKESLWPLACGLSCCAIEMMQTAASRFDLDQFGCLFRSSPRHSDLMIISGTVTKKMAPQIKNLYDQMLHPKFVIAMGNCAISGGIYCESDTVVKGVQNIIPVDIYLPGCPPRPEDLVIAIKQLQNKISPTHSLKINK